MQKIWHVLRREGEYVARCTVERLMRGLGIRGVVRHRLCRPSPLGLNQWCLQWLDHLRTADCRVASLDIDEETQFVLDALVDQAIW